MADAGHEWTDAQLAELEWRYREQYAQAAREMRGKQAAHLARFEREREARERAMDDTPEAREAHRAWLRGQAARQEWLQGMAEELSGAANQANRRASDALNDTIPRVYAENANRAAFEVDRAVRADTGYTMVDQDTVRHLMGLPTDEERLVHEVIPCGPALPSWESLRHDVDSARDIAWNRQRFAAAITQGILQGESIPDIVRRTNDVFGSNLAAAVRAARTACTEAENAGRVNSYARAERLGIELEQEWMATLDERTRESHRAADGQRRKVGEPFDVGGSKLRYPGDPTGAQDQVWNCRCTLVAAVQGAAEQARERWARLPEGTTYDEWRRGRPTTRDASYANPAGILPASWGPAPAPISGRPSAPAPATAAETNSNGYAVDAMHPRTVGGVERIAEAMTFDEANELRGNPRYNLAKDAEADYQKALAAYQEAMRRVMHGEEIAEDELREIKVRRMEALERLNRAQKERAQYTVNCQTCVVANEARRRGYDVMATGNNERKDSPNAILAHDTRRAWIDPATGDHPQYIMYGGPGKADPAGDPIPTQAKYWQWLDSDGVIEEGNRYTIQFAWKGRARYGHIVSLERVDGSLRLYDPQTGRICVGDEVKTYLGEVKYSSKTGRITFADGPKILRVDNMEFNPEFSDRILEARQ